MRLFSRLLPRTRRASDRGSSRSDDGFVVELDRWQLTGLVGFVALIVVVAFIAGRASGGGEAEPEAQTATPVAKAEGALEVGASARERRIALAGVWPPTREIDDNLGRPIEPPLPNDPTERARAQAHIQLQQARSVGLRDDPAAPAIAGGAMAVAAQQPSVGGARGAFTLQISLFETQAAAQVIAGQLEQVGAAVRIRQVRTTDDKALFRVEVGDFASSESALAFQRSFERDTGYSGVLIAL